MGRWWRAFARDAHAVPRADRPRAVILVRALFDDFVGGAQLQAERTARELSRDWDVVVLSRALRCASGLERRDGYQIVRRPVLGWSSSTFHAMARHEVPPGRGVRGIVDFVLALWQLLVLRRGCQILIAYTTLPSGLEATVTARLLGVASLLCVRAESEYRADLATPVKALLCRIAWRLANRIALQAPELVPAFVSRASAPWLSAESLRRKTGVVPNGVDLPRPSLGGHGVMFVGRLHPMKGLDVLLEAVRLLDPSERPLVTIVGGGPSLESLRQAAVDLPIRFAGEVPHDEAKRPMSTAEVFVFPAVGGDGMPNAVMEAMALGLPVIATAVGAIPRLIRNEDNGLLIPPHSPAKLAEALRRLTREPELRARLGARARETAGEMTWSGVREAVTREMMEAIRAQGRHRNARARGGLQT